MNYTLIIKQNGKKVQRVETHSIRRFYTHTRSIKWKKGTSVYCRVYYKSTIDSHGTKIQFLNQGEYHNKPDLLQAINAFLE